jgi:hypothetical protein
MLRWLASALWPPQELLLRLRDDCFVRAFRIPYSRALELAPEIGAFVIPDHEQEVRRGQWKATAAPVGWRSGPETVFVVVSVQVTFRLFPFYLTIAERGIAFDDARQPYELPSEKLYEYVPRP